MEVKEFVTKCGELLTLAKPHFISCEYKVGSEITNAKERILSDAEYAVITCENGYKYYINITSNSLCAIIQAIFSSMAYK